ncbi:2992_t:CDS:2 [Paraglomus occultum]|uniref:2992_t:CDS:1 n=1 Tax=Paraglomus occultum TaxID=144539 RepID=A0A9N9A6I5_9GLOM|nr:2992_t:CDS:2 [Paraglomus occultum]
MTRDYNLNSLPRLLSPLKIFFGNLSPLFRPIYWLFFNMPYIGYFYFTAPFLIIRNIVGPGNGQQRQAIYQGRSSGFLMRRETKKTIRHAPVWGGSGEYYRGPPLISTCGTLLDCKAVRPTSQALAKSWRESHPLACTKLCNGSGQPRGGSQNM